MRMRPMIHMLAFALAVLPAPKASATETVLFVDDFESDTPAGNGLLTNWNVTAGSIDVLGQPFYGTLCTAAGGAPKCLDLDGTSFQAGKIETKSMISLPPGTVRLEFELAGSQRYASAEDTVVVSLGELFSESFTLGNIVPFEPFTRIIEVPAPTTASIVFDHTGSSGDRTGLLLDNVSLTAVTTTITVTIDVNPGRRGRLSCLVNDRSAVIPVAVLSSESFDALQIDPATVELQGLGVKVRGRSNRLLARAKDTNHDGLPDLVVMIENVAGTFPAGAGTATLTGTLLDGSTRITGSDSICVIVPRSGRGPRR